MRSQPDAIRRKKLLEALQASQSVAEAARASGYPRTRIYRMAKADPRLAAALQALKAKRKRKGTKHDQAIAAVAQASTPDEADELAQVARETLLEVMRNPGETARDRVRAAEVADKIADRVSRPAPEPLKEAAQEPESDEPLSPDELRDLLRRAN